MEIKDYKMLLSIINEELGNPSTVMLGIIWTVMDNEGITQPELAKTLEISRPGICRALAKLTPDSDAKTGDILRMEPDAMDTRSLGVYLTRRGKELKRRFLLLK